MNKILDTLHPSQRLVHNLWHSTATSICGGDGDDETSRQSDQPKYRFPRNECHPTRPCTELGWKWKNPKSAKEWKQKPSWARHQRGECYGCCFAFSVQVGCLNDGGALARIEKQTARNYRRPRDQGKGRRNCIHLYNLPKLNLELHTKHTNWDLTGTKKAWERRGRSSKGYTHKGKGKPKKFGVWEGMEKDNYLVHN